MRLLLLAALVLAAPVALMALWERGHLDHLVDDSLIPPEPFIRAELRAKADEALFAARISDAIEAGDLATADVYAETAEFAGIPLSDALKTRLAEARRPENRALAAGETFARGFITGEGEDTAGLAGALAADLTVVGDLRDIGEEGSKMAAGENYSELILGLSVVGLAATTATLASGGAALPIRAGISTLKAARRAGTLTPGLSREVTTRTAAAVNFQGLEETLKGVNLANPGAIKRSLSDYADTLSLTPLRPLLNDTATLQSRLGTAETVRLLRYAENGEDLNALARMSGVTGARTRAVVEITGKTSLRAFKTAINLIRLALTWVWPLLAAFGLLLALWVVRGQRKRRQA